MQTDALEFKKVDNSFNKGEGNYKRQFFISKKIKKKFMNKITGIFLLGKRD